jgi:hypothetical protein
MWLLTTLVPNFLLAWKKGGWYWRGSGHYAGRWWAAAIWLLWVVAANILIYPLIEQGIALLYVIAGEGNGLAVLLATVIIWTYTFVWKGERIRAV